MFTEDINRYFKMKIYHRIQTVPLLITPIKQNNVKLPELDITNFSGDFSTWPTFRNCYETLIHNNNNLSSLEKCN